MINYGANIVSGFQAAGGQELSKQELRLRARRLQEEVLTAQLNREIARADQTLRERELEMQESRTEALNRYTGALIETEKMKPEQIAAQVGLIREQANLTAKQALEVVEKTNMTRAEIGLVEARTGLTLEQISSEVLNRGLTIAQIEKTYADLDATEAQAYYTRVQADYVSGAQTDEAISRTNVNNQRARVFAGQADNIQHSNKTYSANKELADVMGLPEGTQLTFAELDAAAKNLQNEDNIEGDATQLAIKSFGEGEDCTATEFSGTILEIAAECSGINDFPLLIDEDGYFTVSEGDLSANGTLFLVFKAGSGFAPEGETAGFRDGLILDDVVIKEVL